jgi:hypothetical protein
MRLLFLAILWRFSASSCHPLQLLKADRIFERAITIDFQHLRESQSKIPRELAGLFANGSREEYKLTQNFPKRYLALTYCEPRGTIAEEAKKNHSRGKSQKGVTG